MTVEKIQLAQSRKMGEVEMRVIPCDIVKAEDTSAEQAATERLCSKT
jgi:hypothetical protein